MYLLTATLLNSWRVFVETEYGKKADFLRVLCRDPVAKTEAMAKGDEFERWACANLPYLKGGQYQVRLSRTIGNYLCYGIIDVLKAGHLYDVKYTSNYEVGKYRTNYQTPMYLALVPEAIDITYVVSDKPQDGEIWRETYTREETSPLELYIALFENWLKLNGYWDIYARRWQALQKVA